MTTEQINQLASIDSARATNLQLAPWGRPLAITTAIVFCVSLAFPVVAGFVTNRDTWPKWWGVLDVSIAFILAMLALAVIGCARVKRTSQRRTRVTVRIGF